MYSLKKSFSSRQTQSFESYSSSSYSQKYESSSSSNLQKSNSMVMDKRGFKPSDRHDPRARDYLTKLSKKIWHPVSKDSNLAKVLCVVEYQSCWFFSLNDMKFIIIIVAECFINMYIRDVLFLDAIIFLLLL